MKFNARLFREAWLDVPPLPLNDKTASIAISPRQARRTGIWLIWQAVRHPRTPVTFELWEDPRA